MRKHHQKVVSYKATYFVHESAKCILKYHSQCHEKSL